MAPTQRDYLSGFGNEFASEALAGALPRDQNTPRSRRCYASRSERHRVLRRRAASVAPRGHIASGHLRCTSRSRRATRDSSGADRSTSAPPTPNQLRWRAMPIPAEPTDFIDGIVTIGGNGDPASQSGAAIHAYAANISMRERFFYNADGELLIVPAAGGLIIC